MDRDHITPALASRLIAAQFPRWAELPLRAVETPGWDNVTFRLGEEMSVRLPTSEQYAAQVDKEHRWLPVLAAELPLPIPEPLEMGTPAFGYPWRWSIYRWLSGSPATVGAVLDLNRFAEDLAGFLVALHGIDPKGGPSPSDRDFFRRPLYARDREARDAIAALEGEIDTASATAVWEKSLRAPASEFPVWIHADLSPSNLLVIDGRLGAVIDFGCSGIGDPAFDLEPAWGFLSGESRAVFRAAVQLDEPAWARARGWRLWGALTALVEGLRTAADWVPSARQTIQEVLADDGSDL